MSSQDKQGGYQNLISNHERYLYYHHRLNNIEIGTPIQPDQPSTTNTNTAYEQYKANLKTFQQMVNAIQQGVMTKDNPAFIALKAQLTADFNVDCIDLF